jgi:hypothetical protein
MNASRSINNALRQYRYFSTIFPTGSQNRTIAYWKQAMLWYDVPAKACEYVSTYAPVYQFSTSVYWYIDISRGTYDTG